MPADMEIFGINARGSVACVSSNVNYRRIQHGKVSQYLHSLCSLQYENNYAAANSFALLANHP